MENHQLMSILRLMVLGIAVAVGGLFFSDLWGHFFNGLPYEHSTLLGMGAYLCILLVICTGLILSRLKERKEGENGAVEQDERG